MARKSIFNFMGKKIDVAEITGFSMELLDQLAFKELALYIGTSYIANALSKCEFKVYEGGKEAKNKLYYMLNVSPNPNENSSQFMNKFIEKFLYEQCALIVPQNGFIYCADSFDIDDENPLKENVFYNITFNCHELKKKYKASDVFYMKLEDKNVKALIDGVYSQYGDIISLALSAYKRTNGAKYKLLLEQYSAGDPKFQEHFENVIKKQLKSFMESDNAVYPQFKGTDLQVFEHNEQKSRKDASDIVTMRKEIFEVTAQALKIPLPMMYGNITNMQEIVKVFLSFCIDPKADMISEEITRKYYGFDGWEKGDYVKLDTSCINYVDILEVADKVDKAISSGVTNIDELRERLGMNALGTEFSTSHFITKNYELAENMLKGGE